MGSYSPISEIKIKNFRNLGDISLNFNDSPIIALIGENESGKTSIVKAFGVCAMHADSRSQKDFIRDGSNGFGVQIVLEDGSNITRIKTPTLNRYIVNRADGSTWEANKLDSGTPAEVQKIMGLIEEPETKEPLHIRTYEDQLLFVVTPASTNYKVMYNALKISQLTKAIQMGSREANDLRADINSKNTSIETLNQSISKIKTFDVEPLIIMRDRLQKNISEIYKLDKAISLLDSIDSQKNELSALNMLSDNNISEIDLADVVRFNQIGNLIDNIEQLKNRESTFSKLSSIEPVRIELIEKLNLALVRSEELRKMQLESKNYISLSEVSSINEVEMQSILRVESILNRIESNKALLNTYQKVLEISEVSNSELESIVKMDRVINFQNEIINAKSGLDKINEFIDGVLNWMKQIGVATASCPKCGESIVIDTNAT